MPDSDKGKILIELKPLETPAGGTPNPGRLAPAVVPIGDIVEQSTFSTIRQGTATNELTKLKSAAGEPATLDPITGTATITKGDFVVTLPEFATLSGLRTSAYQLLDALTVVLTEAGAKSPSVALSLEEYMKKRGLKDKKAAREQAVADLNTLFAATISFKEKRKLGQERDFHDIRIIDGKGIKNGIIHASFGTTFYNILLGYPIMPYPARLWTLNSNKNPNSFYLLRKIAEHKNMNVGKKNEDLISVKTLLAATPNLPSYEEVMKGDRHVDARIIQPFERDMDALADTLTWTYCHKNNRPLTDEELEGMNYSTLTSLLVKVDWKKYPDQTARLEKKAERQKRGERAKKRAASKREKQLQKSAEETKKTEDEKSAEA